MNIPMTMMIGIALVIFSYHLTAPIRELSTLITRSTLAVALATVMLGLLMMITRKHAVTQIIGFLALGNGLFFAATSATYGMPLVVELEWRLIFLSRHSSSVYSSFISIRRSTVWMWSRWPVSRRGIKSVWHVWSTVGSQVKVLCPNRKGVPQSRSRRSDFPRHCGKAAEAHCRWSSLVGLQVWLPMLFGIAATIRAEIEAGHRIPSAMERLLREKGL